MFILFGLRFYFRSINLNQTLLVRYYQYIQMYLGQISLSLAKLAIIELLSYFSFSLKVILIQISVQMSANEKQAKDLKEGAENRKIGNYLMGKTIGQGTFNKVKIGRHLHSNEQVAIKLIDKSKLTTAADHNRLSKELKILRKARHPNIIQLYEIFEDVNFYYVVTEFSSRGQLFEHIVSHEKITEFEASKYLQQILNAIEYMHELGVVHRDLKPENVLLDYKYNVKIIDFGLSNIYNKGETLSTACGSPCYAAPEMLSGKAYCPLKIDIWSLGIILYAMCFGYLPFDNPDSVQLYRLIKSGKYEVPDHASQQLIDLLKIILEVEPTKRASIEQIRQHPFCKFTQSMNVSGIIQGLSVIPFQQHLKQAMDDLNLDTSSLKLEITNNKHSQLTATYYLLLQQWLRQRNQSILNYFTSKNSVINRYKVIQKVKENYQKRLIRLEKKRQESNSKRKSKTLEKKYNTGEASTAVASKNLFASPQRVKKSRKSHTNSKKKEKVRKLKRS